MSRLVGWSVVYFLKLLPTASTHPHIICDNLIMSWLFSIVIVTILYISFGIALPIFIEKYHHGISGSQSFYISLVLNNVALPSNTYFIDKYHHGISCPESFCISSDLNSVKLFQVILINCRIKRDRFYLNALSTVSYLHYHTGKFISLPHRGITFLCHTKANV